jgi:hypothetical protein
MSDSLSRRAYDANLPDGAAWIIAPSGDMDKLFDGIAAGEDLAIDNLRGLSDTRDPWKTTDIVTLEREYGMLPDPSLTDAQRRARVAALAYAPKGTGSRSYLQARLHEAGFTNLFVYDNSPNVDPDHLVGARYHAMCGFETSVCGNEAALCGGWGGGEYIANGDRWSRNIAWTTACGLAESVCGYYEATCGAFIESRDLITPDPPPAGTWNFVFFIGGAVIRDGLGAIIEIEQITIPENLRALFVTVVTRHKPLYTWAACAVEWAPVEPWTGYGYFPYGNSAYGL